MYNVKTEGKADASRMCGINNIFTCPQYIMQIDSTSRIKRVYFGHEWQISNFNGVHMHVNFWLELSYKVSLSPSMGYIGPDGQNIPDHRELLIREKAFCERQYLNKF